MNTSSIYGPEVLVKLELCEPQLNAIDWGAPSCGDIVLWFLHVQPARTIDAPRNPSMNPYSKPFVATKLGDSLIQGDASHS